MTQTFAFRTFLFVAFVGLSFNAALAQLDGNTRTGTEPGDLQLNGAVAPPAKMDIPSMDDAITKHAPATQDVDSFIAGDPPAIVDLDPDRNPKASPAADLSPKLPLEEESTQEQPAPEHSPAPSGQETTVAKTAENGAANTLARENMSADIAALNARVQRLEMLIEAQSATLAEMAKLQTQMLPAEELKAIREEIVALRQSFQTVARPDLESGTQDLQPTEPSTGLLVIENLTGIVYTMNVNGYDIYVMPGRQSVPIEVGNVRTEIRGYEAPRAWSSDNFQLVNGQPQLAIQIQ